jgi:hypothetical protein
MTNLSSEETPFLFFEQFSNYLPPKQGQNKRPFSAISNEEAIPFNPSHFLPDQEVFSSQSARSTSQCPPPAPVKKRQKQSNSSANFLSEQEVFSKQSERITSKNPPPAPTKKKRPNNNYGILTSSSSSNSFSTSSSQPTKEQAATPYMQKIQELYGVCAYPIALLPSPREQKFSLFKAYTEDSSNGLTFLGHNNNLYRLNPLGTTNQQHNVYEATLIDSATEKTAQVDEKAEAPVKIVKIIKDFDHWDKIFVQDTKHHLDLKNIIQSHPDLPIKLPYSDVETMKSDGILFQEKVTGIMSFDWNPNASKMDELSPLHLEILEKVRYLIEQVVKHKIPLADARPCNVAYDEEKKKFSLFDCYMIDTDERRFAKIKKSINQWNDNETKNLPKSHQEVLGKMRDLLECIAQHKIPLNDLTQNISSRTETKNVSPYDCVQSVYNSFTVNINKPLFEEITSWIKDWSIGESGKPPRKFIADYLREPIQKELEELENEWK